MKKSSFQNLTNTLFQTVDFIVSVEFEEDWKYKYIWKNRKTNSL